MDEKRKRGTPLNFRWLFMLLLMLAAAGISPYIPSLIRAANYTDDTITRECIAELKDGVVVRYTSAGRGDERISITRDGGKTWAEEEHRAYYEPPLLVEPDCQSFVRLNDVNFLYYTTTHFRITHDGGQSWHGLTLPASLHCPVTFVRKVHFDDALNGYTEINCKDDYFEGNGVEYHLVTTDSAKTWQTVSATSE